MLPTLQQKLRVRPSAAAHSGSHRARTGSVPVAGADQGEVSYELNQFDELPNVGSLIAAALDSAGDRNEGDAAEMRASSVDRRVYLVLRSELVAAT